MEWFLFNIEDVLESEPIPRKTNITLRFIDTGAISDKNGGFRSLPRETPWCRKTCEGGQGFNGYSASKMRNKHLKPSPAEIVTKQ